MKVIRGGAERELGSGIGWIAHLDTEIPSCGHELEYSRTLSVVPWTLFSELRGQGFPDRWSVSNTHWQ